MKVTIIKDDGVVGVDGVFRAVDVSGMPDGVRVMQWDETVGHSEYYDVETANTVIETIAAIQSFIDLWTAAAPPPPEEPTEGELLDLKVAEWQELFRRFMDSVASAQGTFYNLTDACSYAGTANALQAEAISLVEWSALARADAKAKFTDLTNGVTTVDGTYGGEFTNFSDSLPIYTVPGE